MALINSMSMRGKITLAACALGFLAAAVFIVKMAGAPSYTTVMTGVDPAKTSQITAALTAAGVPFELQNGGTAVGVQKGKETAANVALAAKGLNAGATQPGFEILDKQKLGASSQQQQVAYQRGAGGHDRQHDRPDRRRRRRAGPPDAGPRTTSSPTSRSPRPRPCCCRRTRAAMDPASVKGIANLVAASVPAPEGRLRDDHRRLRRDAVALGRRRGGGGGADGLPSKTAAEARYNASAEASLQCDARPHARPGQGAGRRPLRPQRRQDRRADAHLHRQERVALAEKTDDRVAEGQRQRRRAAPSGTASNLPSYAANATGGSGTNNYKNTTTDKTNGARQDHHQDRRRRTGAVNRLDVAVLLDKSVELDGRADDLAEGQRSPRPPACRSPSASDTLNVTEGLSFAKVPTTAAKSGPIPAAARGILKGVGIGIGALLFLFFVTRHLRKRERGELIDEPSWLRSSRPRSRKAAHADARPRRTAAPARRCARSPTPTRGASSSTTIIQR